MKNQISTFVVILILSSVIGCTQRVVPNFGSIPLFTFTERSGGPFGSPHMKGKINVVDFIFTRCQGVCPKMAAKMTDLYQTYADSSNIQFVSITVDPEHDTLEVLRQYAVDNRVLDDMWLFLWAPIEEVVDLSENGFKLAADNLPGGHSSKFVLVDEEGNIRGYYSGVDPDGNKEIKRDINILLKEIY